MEERFKYLLCTENKNMINMINSMLFKHKASGYFISIAEKFCLLNQSNYDILKQINIKKYRPVLCYTIDEEVPLFGDKIISNNSNDHVNKEEKKDGRTEEENLPSKEFKFKYIIFADQENAILSFNSILHNRKVKEYYISKTKKFCLVDEDGYNTLRNIKPRKNFVVSCYKLSDPIDLFSHILKERGLTKDGKILIRKNMPEISEETLDNKNDYIHPSDLSMIVKISWYTIKRLIKDHNVKQLNGYIYLPDFEEKILHGRKIKDLTFLTLNDLIRNLDINPEQSDKELIEQIERKYNIKPTIQMKFNVVYTLEDLPLVVRKKIEQGKENTSKNLSVVVL